jgi:predicted metal-dependent phosphoesterase TrpH
MIKLDLHTHSTDSHDGGISLEDYKHLLSSDVLDYVAITDHNSTSLAHVAKAEIGDAIIVGEEIMTTEGEIVGLFLESTIPPGLSPEATIAAIKSQDGIVYIPHPFETIRKGLHPAVLEKIVEDIDIIEVCNGRAFAQNRSEQTVVWAKMNHIPGAASSDAHGIHGIGRTYSAVKEKPTRENLIKLIKDSTPITSRPSLRSLLYPKYHTIKKKVKNDK